MSAQSSQQPSQTITPAPSGSQQSGASGSGSGSATTRISIPQSAPVGGLTITQPPQTATSFYKIAQSNPVTFGWNFTSLYSQPAHLTLHAVGENSNTYPVGPSDGIIDGTATSVVWDLYEYNQQNPNTPLAQGSYNLRIWDDRGPDAVRAPGLFDPNSALKFALYSPAAYTPLASGWQCSGCKSGALESFTAHPAFGGIVATLVVMLISGYGLLRVGPR